MRRGGHALVTGAAGAIGGAIAAELRARDAAARLSLVDLDEAGARRQAEALGGDAAPFRWDLSAPAELDAHLARLGAERGGVDLLVNCAGLMEVRSLAATPWSLAERLLRIDLESPLKLMAALVPGMVERGSGAVVNVASMAGVTPLRGCSYYGAAKAGLAMASEIAHLELGPRGVRVVTVYPGPVRSALERRARGQYVDSPWSRFVPAGDPSALARRVVDACERGAPRVVYPGFYDLASRFPTWASRAARALCPPPRD
ncbi:MAG TPA: SDR family oxidoreductase [Polyangiaceae bacterium]|nr:SDR family oxidoreductase [Polyangiaceae bacterium]